MRQFGETELPASGEGIAEKIVTVLHLGFEERKERVEMVLEEMFEDARRNGGAGVLVRARAVLQHQIPDVPRMVLRQVAGLLGCPPADGFVFRREAVVDICDAFHAASLRPSTGLRGSRRICS